MEWIDTLNINCFEDYHDRGILPIQSREITMDGDVMCREIQPEHIKLMKSESNLPTSKHPMSSFHIISNTILIFNTPLSDNGKPSRALTLGSFFLKSRASTLHTKYRETVLDTRCHV